MRRSANSIAGGYIVCLNLLLAAGPAIAQESALPELAGVPDWLSEFDFDRDEFTFVRVKYESRPELSVLGDRFSGCGHQSRGATLQAHHAECR